MKFFSLLTLVLCLSFCSCGKSDDQKQTSGNAPKDNNNAQQTTPPEPPAPKHDETIPEAKESPDKKTSTTDKENGIRVNFPTGSTQVSMNGKINGFGDNITYLFNVKAGQKLTASVKPQSGKGNIRISQIIAPSGKADGPFDNPMTYSLTQAGDWKLVLSENQMAGDPWTGEYVLTVEIR